jgi:hypothetical protein
LVGHGRCVWRGREGGKWLMLYHPIGCVCYMLYIKGV